LSETGRQPTLGPVRATAGAPGFHHEAFFYASRDEFVAWATSFIRRSVADRLPVLVVVDAPKIDLLRAELDGEADGAEFADMDDVGANPARIIPAWQDFIERHSGAAGFRGIGEPIHTRRSATELVECHRHEALLNVAFEDTPDFQLLCPYDTVGLAPEVVAHARATHPILSGRDGMSRSKHYCGTDGAAHAFSAPLPEPAGDVVDLAFDGAALGAVRDLVGSEARLAGLGPAAAADLALAANEITTNSVRHGGGSGRIRLWRDDDVLVCDVVDAGHIGDPLVGRRRPHGHQTGGYGAWMANQLCDLVQIRTSGDGTVVRLHKRIV
jgi:anti-sigma regulatory factor (Ser/Thr protein kinase)